MLLPWGGTSVLGHIIQQWQALGAEQIAVVIAKEARNLRQELDRLNLSQAIQIENPAPDSGMFGSIQCAARWPGWNESLRHWVIVLGDQPHLQIGMLRQLLDFAAQNPEQVCQPMHGSRWRHPVVLPKHLFQQLSSAKAGDLQEFLLSCDRAGYECEDPGLDHDIDTPEDYRQALAMASSVKSTGRRAC
jgi:CTP:molybdopterin cytidylyltransferase MocA